MPAVDAATGAVLLAERDHVALSPDGHGGTLRALARGGCLDDMRARGIETVFYLQVDNPMIAIGDPGFVGAHRLAGADVSSKVVRKRDPGEKVGIVAERAGRQLVIEYSDLPDRLAAAAAARRRARVLGGEHRPARVRARVHRRPGRRRPSCRTTGR